MKFTAIRASVAKQLGLRIKRCASHFACHGGLKSTAGAMALAGAMTFEGSAHLASAQTELLLNESFENNDGVNDSLDFLVVEGAFDAANGAGALQALISGVPEPSSVILTMAGVVLFVAGRRRV